MHLLYEILLSSTQLYEELVEFSGPYCCEIVKTVKTEILNSLQSIGRRLLDGCVEQRGLIIQVRLVLKKLTSVFIEIVAQFVQTICHILETLSLSQAL